MFYVTGDTHIPIDISKLNTKNFPEQKDMTKNDYVIICGDFGGVWNGSNEEKYWLKWLTNKNFTTLFVSGNHENFNMLNEFPVENWNGGKIQKITDSVYHLMRGQIFEIDGIKFFTMGGASSHDKIYRRENISWWPAELPSDAEYEEAVKNLKQHNFEVDYVISHCISDSVMQKISCYYEHDKLTNFFEVIKDKLKFKHWYFGHYHIDRNIDEKHTCLYQDIIKI